MMQLKTGYALVITLAAAVLLIGCDTALGFTHETVEMVYTVKTAAAQNGTIRAAPDSGIAGTPVMLAVNPQPGYRLKAGSIQRAEGNGVPMADDNLRTPPYRFTLANNNTIYAEFEKITGSNFTVTVDDAIEGGTIIVYSLMEDLEGLKLQAPNGPEGKEIILKFYPQEGFALKEGSVKWTRLNAQNKPTANVFTLDSPYSFALPAANVTITAVFESPDAIALVESGKKALRRSDYDAAVIAFEGAYRKDPHNAEALFYSSIGKLASITVDGKVRQLLSSIGISNYPGNLNNMFTLGDAWDNFYTDETYTTTEQRPGWLGDFSGVRLPDYGFPGGYYAFQNQQSVVQESKDKYGNPSMATWQLVMFFNLMGSNISSINDVVDDALTYVFGSAFEEASNRAAQLAYTDRFTLDQGIIDNLFANSIFTAGDKIGRAELDEVIASFRLMKAALEWVSAYDLETDRYMWRMWSYVHGGNFLPTWPDLFDELNRPYTDPADLRGEGKSINEILNIILDFVFSNMNEYFYERPTEASRIPDMMPLLNHLFMERSHAAAMMNKSRADLIQAINMYAGAYQYYVSDAAEIPQLVQSQLGDYQWISDCLAQLKSAVSSGGNFYYPQVSPKGKLSWDYTAANAKNGINFGKLFTPGQLNLNRLIVTESGGRRPKFYGWNTGGTETPISAYADIAQYEHIGFMFDLKSLKEVFVQGLELDGRPLNDTEYAHVLFPHVYLTRTNGIKLYEFYHGLYHYLKN
ncbi:hypothetical protein AGMMS4952_19390 [Spirochaetia bacterium]|nr:hypothetical protein AGMMS4952_19390 [Spirochaetia bacterium]